MDSWHLREGDPIGGGRSALRLLGGGLRYEAYLAWDERLRTTVVCKLVRPDLVEDPDALAGLAREARAVDELAHPLMLRGLGLHAGVERPHLVLEHVEGPRLSTLARRYGLAIEQLLTLALDLSSALHFVAQSGWLHLDVKPRNIIMAADPRLIDLSIARTIEEARALRRPAGTDAFMAPEQCDPARFSELGPPADVWGLGATLVSALCHGDRPFEDDGRAHPQLRRRPRPLPRRTPAPLQALVLECLAPRPQDRPTAAQLGEALEPFVEALPPPRMGRFRPATPIRRPVAAA